MKPVNYSKIRKEGKPQDFKKTIVKYHRQSFKILQIKKKKAKKDV